MLHILALHRRAGWRLATVALSLGVLATSEIVVSQSPRDGRRPRTTVIDGREAIDGEVLIRYRSDSNQIARERAEFQAEADEVEPIGRRGARRVRSRRLTTGALLQTLRDNPDVEFVEPNYVVRVRSVPNDPWFPFLWGLRNTGQEILYVTGTVGADISATRAWDTTTGSRANVVGIVDTGVDYTHPDLAANMWTAPRAFSVVIGGIEINCAAGTHGFDAITNTCDPTDDHSHGTHVAGTIGAVGDDGVGVTGVNWTASMMALKFIGASGNGTTANAIKAIEFALQAKSVLGDDANIRILSNSWVGAGFSQALRNQIDAANAQDMLFVAAAGNDGLNNDTSPNYPSSFTSANIISVAATTHRDLRAWFSNYGATSVHLGAPGEAILSTIPNNDYAFFDGTSMATPHVSGAAALVLAACARSTAELKDMLLNSVDPANGMAGITITSGRLNVDAAVAQCFSSPPALSISSSGTTVTVGVTDGPANPKDWLGLYCPATNGDSGYYAARYLNGSTSPPATGLRSATVVFTAPASGTCQARLFLNGGARRIATSDTIPVGPQPPSMTVTNPNVAPNTPISVVVQNGPANPADWVGLYAEGAPDSPPIRWSYLNGSTTPPSPGRTGATLQFVAPGAPGNYHLRFFANNGYARLATSNTITVAPQPTLTINDVSIAEGNAGTSNATFTVTLSPVHATQTVTVAYATANGSATAGSDYTAVSGTLTFAPTVATQTITVLVNGDSLFENNESFTVNLSSAANASIGDAQGLGTILTDDLPPLPSVTMLTPTVNPGGTIQAAIANGPGFANDWLGLHLASADDRTYVDWVYTSGSRVPGSGTSTATVQFTAPTTPGTYNVRLFTQGGFTKVATSPNALVASLPALSIDDVTVTEGNAGTTVATFTVSLTPVNPSQTVTVNYTTSDSTATAANNDYTPTSGTLTFDPLVATRTVSVTVHGDTVFEQNERFFLLLSNSVGAPISDLEGAATIANDDVPPVPSGPSVSVPASVAPGGSFDVTVAGGPANPADWIGFFTSTADDRTYQRWSYLNNSTTPPTSGMANATLTLAAPTVPGTYNLRLFANNGFTKLATSNTLTVASQPTLRINDVSVNEGDSGQSIATFTVTLSPPNTSQPVTVDYVTANGTAELADNDYVAAGGTLTFAPSETAKTVSVIVNGDTKIEPYESVFVNLSNAANALIDDAQGLGTIVNDDGPPGPQVIAPASAAAGTPIVVNIQNGPGNQADWIGLYSAANPDDRAFVHWVYLNGTQVPPDPGRTSGTLTFTAPATPGTYQFRFFLNNGYTRLAVSSTITVTP